MTTYKELAYLESTGTQYIDTGVVPTLNTSFELSGVDMDYTSGTTRFGSRVDVTNENYCFTSIASSDFRFTCGSGPSTTSIQYVYSTHKLAKKVSFSATTKICTITFNDDTTESSPEFNTTPITSAAKSIYLFAFNNNDTPVFGISKQTGLKIYEDGVLVRNYIPVLDFNNTPAMYDKVNDVLYYNQGTGQFLYGANETESSIQMRRKFNMLLASKKTGEYTPVKYIQSSGTQYIVSPVQFYGDNYKIECKFDNSDTPLNTTPFGYQNTDSGVQIMVIGFNNANSTGTIFWNGTSTAHENRAKLNVMTKGLNELVIEANNETLTYTLNGASPVSYETYTSFEQQTENMWIFGNNRQSMGGSHQLATMKFYYLRIYQNNEIKYNFISVLDSNGVPCILETVSGVYYYNQGTGDFTYEEWDFTPVDYVYANGNAYLNTLWYGDSNTKMEMVFDIAEQASENTGSMGSRINANRQLLAIGYGTSALAADFNNSSYSPYRAAIVYETNKKYRAYTSKGKRSIIDEDTGVVLDENNTLCADTLSTGILLFGAETGISAKHNGNIWLGKIWEGDTLVRDYIPVVDGDNKGCFYDKTLNALFYSRGSSDFVGHFIENGVNYKVVKNIESTGTQYINTGLCPTNNHSVEIDYRFVRTPSVGERVGLFGTLTSQASPIKNPRYGDLVSPTTNKLEYGYGINNAYYQTNTPDTNRHVIKHDKNKLYVDGVLVNTFDSDAFSCATTAYLFNFNYTNYTPALSKYYKSKWWDGNKLIRHYIPVLRESNNEPGMFDVVNKQFYENVGTGTFNYEEV